MDYKTRIADESLEKRLKNKGAVVVEGAKWCGKTTTCERHSVSALYLSNSDQSNQLIKLADISPSLLLQGATPRLIDEWQLAPKLWDAARFEVDHRDELGQFIFTGSATPEKTDLIHHTGTGRFAWIRMRPMSLYESGDSSGKVSLLKLFENDTQTFTEDKTSLENLAFFACRGGWPKAISLDREGALEQAFDYIDAIAKSDIRRVDGVLRSESRARQLMRVLARHQGTQVPDTAIANDIQEKSSLLTVKSYIGALEKIFVIEDAPAWNPNLRSKTAIRTSATHYFTDPSIATATLQLGPGDLMKDLNTFGFIFEALCIRDLRVYAEALHGQVYHFRTKDNLECDAVIHLRDGRYGLVEIKLGGDRLIGEGVKTLKTVASKIDTQAMREPSFLMVLAGVAPYAYKREDGVFIVPITTLKN